MTDVHLFTPVFLDAFTDGTGLVAPIVVAGVSCRDRIRIYSGDEAIILGCLADQISLRDDTCLVGWDLQRIGKALSARALVTQIPCRPYRLPCIDLQCVVARMLPDDNGTDRPCLARTCAGLGIQYTRCSDGISSAVCIRNYQPESRHLVEDRVRQRLDVFQALFLRMEDLCRYDLALQSGWGPNAVVEFSDPCQSRLDL